MLNFQNSLYWSINAYIIIFRGVQRQHACYGILKYNKSILFTKHILLHFLIICHSSVLFKNKTLHFFLLSQFFLLGMESANVPLPPFSCSQYKSTACERDSCIKPDLDYWTESRTEHLLLLLRVPCRFLHRRLHQTFPIKWVCWTSIL